MGNFEVDSGGDISLSSDAEDNVQGKHGGVQHGAPAQTQGLQEQKELFVDLGTGDLGPAHSR